MTIFNIRIIFEKTLVVVAGNTDEAEEIAREEALNALYEDRAEPAEVDIRGEVRSKRDLRDGWDLMSIPYGLDGNTRLQDLLPKSDDE
jgi:hypothetical protein